MTKYRPRLVSLLLVALLLVALLLVALLLAACGNEATVLPPTLPLSSPTAPLSPTTVGAATTSLAVPTLAQSSTAAATPTLVFVATATTLPRPTTAPPTTVSSPATTAAAITTTPGGRDLALAAVRKLSQDSQTFRYKVGQQGQLVSGGSVSEFTAQGEGSWQRPAFRQLMTLQLAGQQRQLEIYGRDRQLFQRTVELVVWRRQEPPIAGPFPALNRVEQATNFKSAGKETINGESASKVSWEVPASTLLPSAGQPEGIGALSITNLYQPFAADTASQAQATLWVSDATGLPLRYGVTFSLKVGQNTLNYTATFDYSDFNSNGVRVEIPGDLPK